MALASHCPGLCGVTTCRRYPPVRIPRVRGSSGSRGAAVLGAPSVPSDVRSLSLFAFAAPDPVDGRPYHGYVGEKL